MTIHRPIIYQSRIFAMLQETAFNAVRAVSDGLVPDGWTFAGSEHRIEVLAHIELLRPGTVLGTYQAIMAGDMAAAVAGFREGFELLRLSDPHLVDLRLQSGEHLAGLFAANAGRRVPDENDLHWGHEYFGGDAGRRQAVDICTRLDAAKVAKAEKRKADKLAAKDMAAKLEAAEQEETIS